MAAAVFIPPSPHDPLSSMATASRRAPLASIPNIVNSPHRLLNTSGSKRPRAQANVSQQENEPPLKRQAVEKTTTETGPSTPTRQLPNNPAEGRVFERGHGASGSTAFQRKLVAARDRNSGLRVTKNVEPPVKDDTVRQWQKHYRKIFPTFSFYFDSVGDDMRSRFVRNITLLGAKEEKFFSKSVTHIITTRNIPPESEVTKAHENGPLNDDQPSTINPSLLDKSAPAALQSKAQSVPNVRKDGSSHLDILQRGRQMEMKLWSTDKLNRVLTTVLDDASSRTQQPRVAANIAREDLSQVLRNDKLGAATERDPSSLIRELVPFKGPFLYIHDIDEKHRPTMVREYQSVARRTDGEWPQFRSAGIGKCPFVEDPATKREIEQDRRQKSQQAQVQREASQIPRTRSNINLEPARMEPPRRTSPRKTLKEVRNPGHPPATINPGLLSKASQPRLDPQLSFPPMPDHQKFDFVRPPLMHMPREPAASGIQRSTLTSAIQSQMISSTAATGVKAGTSKDMHELKRKVLERSHTGSLSVGSIPSSHRMTDITGVLKTARAPAPQRAAKSKAQEKLGGIQEEDAYADDIAAEKAAHASSRRKKQAAQKDPKPGYCENCRDKYDDFGDHVVSRKHRKFAMTQTNWTELDALLSKLQDP